MIYDLIREAVWLLRNEMDGNKMEEKMHLIEFNHKNFFVRSPTGLRVAEGGGGLEGWRFLLCVYKSVHSVQCSVLIPTVFTSWAPDSSNDG